MLENVAECNSSMVLGERSLNISEMKIEYSVHYLRCVAFQELSITKESYKFWVEGLWENSRKFRFKMMLYFGKFSKSFSQLYFMFSQNDQYQFLDVGKSIFDISLQSKQNKVFMINYQQLFSSRIVGKN